MPICINLGLIKNDIERETSQRVDTSAEPRIIIYLSLQPLPNYQANIHK